MTIPAGARRLAAGVYVLGDELHVDVAELCAAAGVPPTEGSAEALLAAVRDVVGAEIPVDVVVADHGSGR
jgi:hypothetical protein